jgi:hypothetical protein
MSVKALNAAIAELPLELRAKIVMILSNWHTSDSCSNIELIRRTSDLLDECIPGVGLDLMALYESEATEIHDRCSLRIKNAIEKMRVTNAANTTSAENL